MDTKTIIISLIALILFLVGIILLITSQENNYKEETFTIKGLELDNTRKIHNIFITKEIFQQLDPGENFSLYYFPNKCPDFSDDILIVENTKHGKKYYLPEINTLIKIPKDHEWTKKSENLEYLFKEGFLDTKKEEDDQN